MCVPRNEINDPPVIQERKLRVVSYNSSDINNPYFCGCGLVPDCPHIYFLRLHIAAEYEYRNSGKYSVVQGISPHFVNDLQQ